MKAVPPRRRQCCGSMCPGQLPEPAGVLAACAPDHLFHPLAAASLQAQVTANRLWLRERAAASQGLWTLRAVLFQGRLLLSSLLTPSKCLPLGETATARTYFPPGASLPNTLSWECQVWAAKVLMRVAEREILGRESEIMCPGKGVIGCAWGAQCGAGHLTPSAQAGSCEDVSVG